MGKIGSNPISRALFLLLLVHQLWFAPSAVAVDIKVGAIRWDAWFSPPNNYQNESYLQPTQYRERLPFFAKITSAGVEVRDDSQDIMDQEIGYASRAGLSYWAFLYYPNIGLAYKSGNDLNHGLRLYLQSQVKQNLKFTVMLPGEWLLKPTPTHYTSGYISDIVGLVSQPSYQKTIHGRPVIYLLSGSSFIEQAGSLAQAKLYLQNLESAIRSATGQDPYLILLVNDKAGNSYKQLGFDSLSKYSAGDGNSGTYSDLIEANKKVWLHQLEQSPTVVPTVNTGFDYSPRLPDLASAYSGAGIYRPAAKPAQIKQNLASALTWVNQNQSSSLFPSVLIYAWNEFDEGGWLTPTLQEGSARINTLNSLLNPSYTPSSPMIFSPYHNQGDQVLKDVQQDQGTYLFQNSSYLEILGFPTLNLTNFSLEIVFTPLAQERTDLFNQNGTFRAVIESDGSGHCAIATSNNAWYSTGSTATWAPGLIAAGSPHYLACVYDGARLRAFVDGVEQAQSNPLSGALLGQSTETSKFVIGYAPTTNFESFHGTLDQIVLHRDALSPSQVRSNAQRYLQSSSPAPFPSPLPHPGDLDGDAHVNIYDYNILVANFGSPYSIYDYNILVANFGS